MQSKAMMRDRRDGSDPGGRECPAVEAADGETHHPVVSGGVATGAPA